MNKISLLKCMSNSKYRRNNKKLLQDWLVNCGWCQNTQFNRDHMWMRPDERQKSKAIGYEPSFDWTFDEAVEMNAEYFSARILRQRGWAAPHLVGNCVISRECCLPAGTWEELPNGFRKVRGTGGNWTSLRKALKTEQVDLIDNVPTVLEMVEYR